jgi:hypothetical protein
VIVALVSLSACTSAEPDSGASAPSTSASSSGAASNATPAPAPTLDAATQTQLDYEWERVVTENPNAVRPEIEIVRFLEQDEWSAVTAKCMQDEGWSDTKAMSDGVEYGGIPESQVGAFYLSQYTCSAKYPLDPKYNVPLTDERLGALYDYFADELQPCLEAEGYETPPAPSRETFIESYAETGGWNLYETVAAGGQSEWNAINKKCPQIPEDF